MLIPLDGSQLAEKVFVYAKEIAVRLGLELVVLHIADPEDRDDLSTHRDYLDRACEVMTCQAADFQGALGVAECTPVEGRCEVVVGHPAEEILHYADKNQIDLILMATHGASGIRRWVFGSVTEKVIRAAKVPVWLVRAGIVDELDYDQWPSKTLLVPLDGSELAEAVLPHVEALAKGHGSDRVDIVLIRVCQNPSLVLASDYPETGHPSSWDEQLHEMGAAALKECVIYLQRIEKSLTDKGFNVRSQILKGDPSEEIISFADKEPFNLIPMSTHGRSRLGRWAFGSVADKVLRGASRPVFLVRPQSAD
jgi:nucleotide-binding universal stress UspA family protein